MGCSLAATPVGATLLVAMLPCPGGRWLGVHVTVHQLEVVLDVPASGGCLRGEEGATMVVSMSMRAPDISRPELHKQACSNHLSFLNSPLLLPLDHLRKTKFVNAHCMCVAARKQMHT